MCSTVNSLSFMREPIEKVFPDRGEGGALLPGDKEAFTPFATSGA